MRRKIELYIAGELCDISEQNLILFNYTQEDASNPTAVVAPYSQQVTLPGTSRNNRIFGDIFRPDRTTDVFAGWTGIGFDPMRKTPFTVYSDTGEILQDGYVRLDEIVRQRSRVQYKLTLFGGIGSFFYGLSYKEDGTQMTLADLAYNTGLENELDFDITAANVTDAWANISTPHDLWNIINFAPAYEGLPDGDFDPKKAVATPANVGLTAPRDGYSADVSGRCVVTLPSSLDEWAVKDLRCYLQRPVINFGKIIKGIKAKATDLGYTFDDSVLSSLGGYSPDKLWLTLPLLSSFAPTSDPLITMTKTASATATNPVAKWTLGGTIPSGTLIDVTVNTKLDATISTSPMPATWKAVGFPQVISTYGVVMFLRLVALSSGSEVASSKIYSYGCNAWETYGKTPLDCFTIIGGTGYAAEDFVMVTGGIQLTALDATTARISPEIAITVSGYDYDEVQLQVVRAGIIRSDFDKVYSSLDEVATPVIPFISSTNTSVRASALLSIPGSASDAVTVKASSSIRSGAHITKRLLLGSSQTPASYLLSYAKMLGLYFDIEPATKTVTLMRRGDFYNGGTVDLTKRIDRKSITLKPVAVDSKYYLFDDQPKGKFAEEYKSAYGSDYGSQKINTGYAFNDNVKDITGTAFKGAVTALERSAYFNYILDGADFIPSPFNLAGCTYTLWNSGESKDFEIQTPQTSDITVTNYNTIPGCEGYDIEFANKLQLHTADGKAVAGEDILVFLEGSNTYEYFKISDDDAAMFALTDGKACWDLDPGPAAGISIPIFQRYTWRNGYYHVKDSLDYGEPMELAFPRQIYEDGNDRTIYGRAWRSYLHDRLDGDTKVMTCNVDLRGMRVDASLLRNFYWYEGALWVLNKISNYAITENAPVQCEFVQVQDADNYTNGQNFS